METPKYTERGEFVRVAATLMAGMLASGEKPSPRLAKKAVETAVMLLDEVNRLAPCKYGE